MRYFNNLKLNVKMLCAIKIKIFIKSKNTMIKTFIELTFILKIE